MPSLKFLFFLFFICHPASLHAQINVDSLSTLLSQSKGTEKVEVLNKIAWELKFSDPDRALKLCKESVDLSKALNYIEGEAQAIYQLAAFSYLKEDFSTSQEIAKESIALYEGIDNSKGLAKNWNLNGMNLQRLNDYSEAFIYYEKASTTCQLFGYDDLLLKVRANIANMSYDTGNYKKALEEQLLISSYFLEQADSSNYYNSLSTVAKSQMALGKYSEALSYYFKIEAYEKSMNRITHLAGIYNSIGVLYLRLGLQEPTVEMFGKSIALYQELGIVRKIAMVSESLGVYYLENEVLEKADVYFTKALQNYDSLDLRNIGRLYNNMASLKIKSNQFDEALSLLKQSLKINQEIGILHNTAKNYANMGHVFFELDQIDKSEQYYLKSLDVATEIGDVFQKQKASEGLAIIYKQKNNQEAFELYSSISQSASDSLLGDEKLMALNRLVIKKLYEENNSKTNKLNKELSVTKEELTQSTSLFKRYSVLTLFLFAFLLISVVWLFKKQKRTSQLNTTLKNKVTEDQEQFEISLGNKNKQLTLLSLEAAQQADLFKKVRISLNQIIHDYPDKSKLKKLEKILTAHSLGQSNWENFMTYFNEVYIGFFERLSNSFPSITHKELRLCALIRLKIPTYEASLILGISPSSVHKSRYRIRKKMKLEAEANMDEFICSI